MEDGVEMEGWRNGVEGLRGGDETLLLPDGGGGREEGRGGEGGEDVREKRGRGDMSVCIGLTMATFN